MSQEEEGLGTSNGAEAHPADISGSKPRREKPRDYDDNNNLDKLAKLFLGLFFQADIALMIFRVQPQPQQGDSSTNLSSLSSIQFKLVWATTLFGFAFIMLGTRLRNHHREVANFCCYAGVFLGALDFFLTLGIFTDESLYWLVWGVCSVVLVVFAYTFAERWGYNLTSSIAWPKRAVGSGFLNLLRRMQISLKAMTNPERIGKELVPVVYATKVSPLAMNNPPTELRQKKSPRKWTTDHAVINIDDNTHKSGLTKALGTNNLDSLDPQSVFSSELEPNDEEEKLYRFSPVPEADVNAAKLNTAVDKSDNEVVQDTSDEETDRDQDEVVSLRAIIRKLTEENAETDQIISELQRANEEKNATITELKRRITKHPQTTTPDFGFEGISAQFDKDHLEHENVTLHTEIGCMLLEKDIVEEKLEVAGDMIDDFVTHTVTQMYQTGENVGEKQSKSKKEDAGGEKHKIENVEEEEEEVKGGGFDIAQDECGPDAKVDSTSVEAYTSILECDTPKRKREKTKVKVKSSSLTRGVKKTFTRVEKRLDDYVYVDLKKGAKNKSNQKWNPSEAPLIHLLPNMDANLLRQIVDCSDADLNCTVWTNDVTREVVPLEDIKKLLQGGDVSNWIIDGLARMLTIQLDKNKINHGNVAYFPCTIWTILHTEKSDMRTVLLDEKLLRVFENVMQHGTKYYWYLVFPMNGSGNKPLKFAPYHWTILLFDVRKKNWKHYNSLKKRDGRDPILKDATFVKKYVENYMKDRHAELKNQSTGSEILFEQQNFDAPICSPQNAPQQENTSVDCGVIVCMLMELLAHLEPIPKTLPKTKIDQFRAGLVSRFLNDEGRSWTIKKWEARRMGKGSQ